MDFGIFVEEKMARGGVVGGSVERLGRLRDDLSQTNNLAAKLPDKAKELHAKLVAWRKELNAPMPTKNTEVGQADSGGKKKKRNRAGNGTASDD